MGFFLGIDCGGTGTRALLADAAGARGGWGTAGVGNPHHAAPAEVRANLRTALEAACREAGAAPTDIVSAFAGVAGVTDEAGRAAFREHLAAIGLAHARLGVDHDIRIALAGGLGGAPGMALIVGTGSSCYGRAADGRTWQSGGWGALIADEGSGYFLGREAIAAAARMADGRESETVLRAAVFDWLGIGDISGLLHRLYQSGLDRAGIAALAPRVVALASDGDHAARQILERGAVQLAAMVAANHRMLPTAPTPSLVITGGLGTADTIYRIAIEHAIHAEVPAIRICPPLLPPAAGAVLLAFGQAAPPDLPGKLQHFTS